eukprot:CAMPEP_0168456050 /NCGR_PEP_ID=MMETSP0228-20121227/51082_1 /TAXON_ID=133427 /ORGANISM="Protoceratium reticulatum, Strain CCCM 535 (=CCMP 1889)" /LENGTH=210 /DNA_ID=CAMNT_0008470947 /DNA_START=44 /DNA_END=672 /DNA_ORIENTATION=-
MGISNAFFCIPLRLSVSLIASSHFAYAFVYIVVLSTKDIRFQSGGYSPYTSRLQAMLGSTGVLFGALGLVGVNDGRTAWVRAFARFLDAKLLVMVIVYLFDTLALFRCDTWWTTPQNRDRSPAMFIISVEGACPMARLCYTVGFAIDLACLCYGAWVTHHFCKTLMPSTMHLIQFRGGITDHNQVKMIGGEVDPAPYLGPPTTRPTDIYG